MDFITIYKQDFQKKPYKKTEPCSGQQQFPDPLGEPYKQYLSLTKDCIEPLEAVDDYSKKFMEEHKKVANIYFKDPIDKECIDNSFRSSFNTSYQTDFGANVQDKDPRKIKSEIKLPEGWNIPLTSQKIDYRNPCFLNENALKEAAGSSIKPISNIGKLTTAVKIDPDQTTYQEHISQLGGMIVEKQLHGKIIYPQCSCAKHNLITEN